MKVNKAVVISLIFIVLAAIFVFSQSIGTTLSVEQKQDCTTTYYNVDEPVYDYATRAKDTYGTCFNSENSSHYRCVNGTEDYQVYERTGTQTVLRNNTDCKTTSFVVSVDKGLVTDRKEIDFSSWGVCVQKEENDCIVVLCGTQRGGSAWKGEFIGCDGGKQCKKFLFCGNEVKVYEKGSGPEFLNEDPTYRLPSLNLKEVGQ